MRHLVELPKADVLIHPRRCLVCFLNLFFCRIRAKRPTLPEAIDFWACDGSVLRSLSSHLFRIKLPRLGFGFTSLVDPASDLYQALGKTQVDVQSNQICTRILVQNYSEPKVSLARDGYFKREQYASTAQQSTKQQPDALPCVMVGVQQKRIAM